MYPTLAERSKNFKSVNNIEVQWFVNTDLKCVYVSDNIYNDYGYTPEEWMSQDVRKNKDYKDILHVTKLAAESVHENKYFSFEGQIKHRNGKLIDVEVTFKAVLNDDGEVDGFFGIIRNINKKNELGKRFIINNKSIQSSKPNIAFLISVVTHDLINPFNIICGYTKLLKDNYHNLSDEERLNYIKKVDASAYANYKLAKNLLDWAKLQNQGFTVKKEILNASDYIKRIIEPYNYLLDKKDINVIIDAKKKHIFYADNNLLKIIVVNLFMNAIKFSKKQGTIKIRLKKAGVQTQISVQDDGVGISEEKLKEIFKLSYIKNETGTEGEKGSGIGLYICKKLIAHHKGTLNITSQINKGTKFVVSV